MPVRPVTDRATWQSGTFTRAYIVKNSGDTTVYLGQDSSLTVATRAFSLPSGSTLNWAGDTELWAVTDAGAQGELEVLYDASSAFTPGPDKVTATIDGPVTVNGNVGVTGDVGISGPVTVTGDVGVSGDINVTNSTLDIEGVVLSRPSAQPVPITTESYAVPTAATSDVHITPFFDVSAYSSLIITLHGVNARALPDWQDHIRVNVLQSDNPLGEVIMTQVAVFLLRSSPASKQATFQLPVTAKFAAVQTVLIKLANAVGFPAGTYRVDFAGSHEVIPTVKYVQHDDNMQGDLAIGGTYTKSIVTGAGTVTASEYISVSNGPAVLNVGNLDTTTINANCLLYTINANFSGLERITSAFIPTAFNDTTQRELYIPCRPVLIVTTRGANSGITVSVNK